MTIALHSAAGGGHKETVELLINKGAHIHQKNNGGKNIIHIIHKNIFNISKNAIYLSI